MHAWRSLFVIVAALTAAAAVTPAYADPVVVAAGDIACRGEPCRSQRMTARLIGRIDPRAVLTLGDDQYDVGALSHFRSSYDPTWGNFFTRTFPSPGNHEYGTPDARGYFSYFGRRAHPRTRGTYAFDLGRWHLVSINSRWGSITEQHLRWIRKDLRRDRHRCELAYWHHPRWSSGSVHGGNRAIAPLWNVLFRAGVDIVLNGHEHNYERFAPMTPSGKLAHRQGIRQFVVGTGGVGLYPIARASHGSRRRIDDRFGVLRLTLHERTATWAFMGVRGTALDRGTDHCR
jgi:acid phosphatase type 7